MPLLSLQDVHRSVGDRHLLRGVGFTIDSGERVGLLGPNGCGKSTLLRMAAGLEVPDQGERVLGRDMRLGYLEQEPQLAPEQRVRDAVREGLVGREAVLERLQVVHAELSGTCHDPRQLDALLAEAATLDDRLATLGGYDVEHKVEQVSASLRLGDLDRRCGTLSGGERRRVALARLLLGQPDLALLDEPTNHLDAESVAWLEEHLANAGMSLLLVTHDRYVLDRVCQRILELDRGELLSYDGNYSDYVDARAERMLAEQREESSRLNLLRRETAWMRRGPAARSTKARARIQRYEQLVDDAPEARGDELVFSIPSGPRLGTRVVELHGVSKGYGGPPVITDLDLELHPGSRLGVVGPNGAGKSTLINLCLGVLTPDAGRVVIGETVRFATIDQERSELHPENTVVQEVAGEGTAVQLGALRLRAESFLEKFLFPGALKHALVGSLSGGERNRVLLAKLLLQGGNVLVLDEPTNDLDLTSLAALEEALIAFPGAVIVVSHDRAFLDRVATHVTYLDGSGRVRVDVGGVSAVLERVARERREREADGVGRGAKTPPGNASGARAERNISPTGQPAGRGGDAPGQAASTRADPGARRLTNWERQELSGLTARIEQAEASLAKLEARLADAALYAGPAAERQRVIDAHAAAQHEVSTLYARWEVLEARRDDDTR